MSAQTHSRSSRRATVQLIPEWDASELVWTGWLKHLRTLPQIRPWVPDAIRVAENVVVAKHAAAVARHDRK
jgi:hypothetical protein